MRLLVAIALSAVTACGATENPSGDLTTDVVMDSDDGSKGEVADAGQEAMDIEGADEGQRAQDSTSLDFDAIPSDVPLVDTQESVDAADYSDIVSHLLLTEASGDGVLMDASFSGYEPYVFGAEVYGELLKLWASEGDTKIEFLVRLDQHELPGSMTPGPPGEDAWALLLLGEENAYVTQSSSGTLQIDVCPQDPGLLLTGQFEGIPMYSMSGLTTENFKINGSFELLLGSVNGSTYCGP